jgi:peptidoglycan/LPS O-acetylase OafA/YrhL
MAVNTHYRPDIDGLRAIAVLSVILYHYEISGKIFDAGFIGVDVFLVISGFLITRILVLSIPKGRFLLPFYQRRVQRIFPALTLTLIATSVMGMFYLLPHEQIQLGKHTLGGSTSIANLFFWQESGYFDSDAASKPLLHLWSLGVEEQFYVVWPIILWLGIRRGIRPITIIGTTFVVSFIYSVTATSSNPTAAFYSPLSRGWELAVGGAIAVIGLRGTRNFHAVCTWIGLAMIGASFFIYSSDDPWPGTSALLPVVGTALVLFGGLIHTNASRLISTRPMVGIGLISYPLYLWHWPLWSFYNIINGEVPSFFEKVVLVFVSFILAYATYAFIERPTRRSERGGTKALVLIGVMVVVGLLGLRTWKSEGFALSPAGDSASTLPVSINTTTTLALPTSVPLPDIVGIPEVENLTGTAEVVAEQFKYWKYIQNLTCLNRYPNPNAKKYGWWICMTNQNAPPTVILRGNSFANQLYPGITNNPNFENQVILSLGNCSIERERNVQPVKTCIEQRDFVYQTIVQNPSIKYALVAGLEWNASPQQLNDLRAELNFLMGRGIKPVVIYPHLRPTFGISACMSRPSISATSDCQLTEDRRTNLYSGFAITLDMLNTEYPSIPTFDMNSVFCTSGPCNFLRNGIPMLRDTVPHISQHASDLVGQALAEWSRANLPDLLDR